MYYGSRILIGLLHGLVVLALTVLGSAYILIGGETGDWFLFVVALVPSAAAVWLTRYFFIHRKVIYRAR